MKRAWALDVLICPSCNGKMRLVALIQDQVTAHKILAHLGIPSRAPPRGRTWPLEEPVDRKGTVVVDSEFADSPYDDNY